MMMQGWKIAYLRRNVDYELYEQPTKMSEFKRITPKEVWDEKGVWLDFGVVFVGYIYAEAEAIAGINAKMKAPGFFEIL